MIDVNNINKYSVHCDGINCQTRKECMYWHPEQLQKMMRKIGHTFKKAEYQDCFKKELVE